MPLNFSLLKCVFWARVIRRLTVAPTHPVPRKSIYTYPHYPLYIISLLLSIIILLLLYCYWYIPILLFQLVVLLPIPIP